MIRIILCLHFFTVYIEIYSMYLGEKNSCLTFIFSGTTNAKEGFNWLFLKKYASHEFFFQLL